MSTPSRFSLTGWNSTYLAPKPMGRVGSPAVAAAAGNSMGTIGSMTANIPAALQNLVNENNQSDAVRALSEALQLSIGRGGGAGGGWSSNPMTQGAQAAALQNLFTKNTESPWNTPDLRMLAVAMGGPNLGSTLQAIAQDENQKKKMSEEAYWRKMALDEGVNSLNNGRGFSDTASGLESRKKTDLALIFADTMAKNPSGWVSQSLVR